MFYTHVSKGDFAKTPFQKEVYTSKFENIIVKTSTNIKFEVPNLRRLTSLTRITRYNNGFGTSSITN